MNEMSKTGAFLGVALVLSGLWWVARPKVEPIVLNKLVGEVLFPNFTDPADAANLQIVRYSEELAELSTFEVEKNGKTGLWNIPTHDGYPADAETRLRDVATTFVGLKALGVATEDAQEHELYGVKEPDKEKTELGEKGVGQLVRFEDQKGKELVHLIIGKPVKGSEGHRFVRIPGQDAVFDVEIDPERFSTKFEDWIEKDLLKISTFDIERIKVKDYSVLRTTQGFAIEPGFDADVKWNNNKWELIEYATYPRNAQGADGLQPQPTELLPGEELNSDKLNELKNALDDLKIVDVRRKPAGLRADLTADASFLDDKTSVDSLFARGFYPFQINGGPELFSANGEVHVYMKEGYEYVLRFGNVAGTQEGTDSSKLNRYLFVTTLVDPTKFPMPELQEVPKKPEPATVPTDPAAATTPPAAEGAEEPKADAVAAQPAEEKSELDQEIERIEKENQRKLDEWNNQKKTAEEKVRELNAHFAEWYYVVSEDVYKKIRLNRNDLIKEGAKAAEEGFGVDAFRKLEKDGLKKTEAPLEMPTLP